MIINVASGLGTGPTELAAFDAALAQVGLGDFNLIRLSSVIPPGSQVRPVVAGAAVPPTAGSWGDRAYVVVAEQREVRPNHEAWAGVGWIQDPTDGRGLFVEHEGGSEAQVRTDIHDSLAALAATRDLEPGEVSMLVKGGTCDGPPLCALVTAIYRSEPW